MENHHLVNHIKASMASKRLYSIQTEGLMRKHNLECDLLSKMRNYCKHRSQLDITYGQSLQKLKSQYAINADEYNHLGFSEMSMFASWNHYLSELMEFGKAHLTLGEFFANHLSETIKNMYQEKQESIKRYVEQLSKLSTELTLSARDLERTQKDYTNTASLYMEARAKAARCRVKLKRSDFGLFESREQVEKENDKCQARIVDVNLTLSDNRNNYLLESVATANHWTYCKDKIWPSIVQTAESGIFNDISTFISTINCVEVENYAKCKLTAEGFSQKVADVLPPDEHVKQFLHRTENQMKEFEKSFNFQSASGDKEDKLVKNATNSVALDNESRKWATSFARNTRIFDELSLNFSQMQKLEEHADSNRRSGIPSARSSMQDLYQRLGEIQDQMFKTELSKLKASVRLELFKDVGYNVDDLLISAHKLTLPDAVSLSGSSNSHGDSRLSIASSSGTFDSGCVSPEGNSNSSFERKARAKYDYEAQNADELCLKKGEVLFIYNDPATESWPMARLNDGREGLVPNNYLELIDSSDSQSLQMSPARLRPPPAGASISNSSSMQNLRLTLRDSLNATQTPADVSTTGFSINSEDVIGYCRASFAFDALNSDDLSFEGGSLLVVLDKLPNGTEDGWWKGANLKSKQFGLFNSWLVDEIIEADLTASEQDLLVSSMANLNRGRRGK